MSDPAIEAAVARLNARYIAAIDADRLEDWPGFFADPCTYQIISAENHEQGMPIGLFFANSRGMLQDRVRALREANIYAAQRYRHVLSPSLVLDVEDGVVRAETNYHVVRILADGAMALFSTGRYLDRIALAPEPHFVEKLVICDSRRIDTLLAIPL
ncbi:MAG: aromatic-ring-hydroxylating dioxygenase subunit beta [Stellaceae bacterium]